MPIVEFAPPGVDCLRLVRSEAIESEREATLPDLPVDVGIADLGDRMFWIELCGTESVMEVDPAVAVAAWRSKIDNCARYMMLHFDERPRR